MASDIGIAAGVGSGSDAPSSWPGEAKGDSVRDVPSLSGTSGDWYCENGSSGGGAS
jgi:hypothetical protein